MQKNNTEKTKSYFSQSHNIECKVRKKNTQKQFNKFLDKRYEIDNKNVRKKTKGGSFIRYNRSVKFTTV